MKNYHYTFTSPSGKLKTKPITLSTKLILQEAEKLGIEWITIPNTEIIELEYGGKTAQFRHQMSPLNSNLAFYACEQKNVTKAFLKKGGVSVAESYMITKDDSESYYSEIFEKLQKPLVVKPIAGWHGDSVTVNINNQQDFKKIARKTLDQLDQRSDGVLAEEMFSGTEYRILATRKKVIGVINRVPANVTGDGKSTIKELIEEKNTDPKREDYFYNTGLLKIPINDETVWALKEKNLTLESVPKKDELVYVRLNSNLSTGGDSIDFTDRVHPSVKEIAIKAVNAVPGLEFAGIDLMSKDITKEQKIGDYIVVEINSSPMTSMHDKPFKGENRHASREFLQLIFPDLGTE